MGKIFQTATRQQISDAVETGLNAMFKELQDRMNVEDGGVAGQYDMGYDADDIREHLMEYLNGYTELERLYAPDEPIDVPMAPESYGSPYHDPNFLDAARTVEALKAFESYSFLPLGGVEWDGMFWRKAGEQNKLVTNMVCGFADEITHTMTVEFAPGSPDIVHIAVQPIDEVQIALNAE